MSGKQKILLRFLDIFGINVLFRFLNRNKAIILWYHGVCDDSFDLLKGYDERHVKKSLFKNQIDYLNRKGYVFATMSELIEALKQGKQIKKFIVLTFDDGFRNVIENGYPVMKAMGAKGCMYVVSGLIGENKLLWTDYIETVVRNCQKDAFEFVYKGRTHTYQLDSKNSREKAMQDIKDKLRMVSDSERKEHIGQFADRQLSEAPKEFRFSSVEQIGGLDRRVLEIGSHTVNHPNCANLTSDSELDNEIGNSRLAIEQITGYPIKHFCYPAGSYNDEVVKSVRKHQYVSATTIIPGFNDGRTDLYRLKRVFVGEDMRLFKASVSGSYFFVSWIIRMLKGKE